MKDVLSALARGKANAGADLGYYQYRGTAYVDPNYCEKCANSGHTWSVDAFADVQSAIASGAQRVLVNPGLYSTTVAEPAPGETAWASGGTYAVGDLRAYAATQAADMMLRKAAALFDAGLPCGEDANIAKLLASEASWAAAEACMQTHGGFGYAREYDVERRWREARVQQIAPISTNLVLAYVAEHVLGMPRSY